jgi:hypothetical protein
MDNWANDLVEKHSKIHKTALARTDMSLPLLNSLASDGYTVIEWQTTSPVPCSICEDLSRQQWDLTSFLSTVHHDAGIFSHSHVNCYCTLILRGPGVAERIVDSYGNIQ